MIGYHRLVDARPSGSLIANRYEILAPLGRGAFRRVYVARDRTNDERVALKELSLRAVDNWKSVELFEREARTLASLDHHLIPRLLDSFVEEGGLRCITVEELIPGETLAKLLEAGWRPTFDEVTRTALDVLDVLHYLETLSPPMLHRDLKPGNLIQRPDGRVVTVDFGGAQELLLDDDRAGSTMIGTYGYMAPEQALGRTSQASDLYSLGATLVHLLTQVAPAELPTRDLRPDFRALAEVPGPLARWLDRLLEPDPGLRWPSAAIARSELLNPTSEGRALTTDSRSLRRARPPKARAQITRDGARLVLSVPRVLPIALFTFTAYGFFAAAKWFLRRGFGPLELWFWVSVLGVLVLELARRPDALGPFHLTLHPERFEAARSVLWTQRRSSGPLNGLTKVRAERFRAPFRRNRGVCVLAIGARELRFGHGLRYEECRWIASELRAYLGQSGDDDASDW